MIKHNKILKKLLLILFFCLLSIFLLSASEPILAATETDTCATKYPDGQCLASCAKDQGEDKSPGLCDGANICCHYKAAYPDINLQVPIFGYSKAHDIAEYITQVYEYFLLVLVPIAIIIVIWAGLRWIFAGGDSPKIAEAKKYITGAISGLIIALLSYVILSLLGLSSIEVPGITYIKPEELPARGGTFIDGGKSGPATGPIGDFDRSDCPNIAGGETEMEVFFTNYYIPAFGDKGHYIDFWCNIAVQCSCPGDKKDTSRNCGLFKLSKSGYTPCAPFPSSYVPGVDYCQSGSMGRTPQADHTIAADMSPIPSGWSEKYGHKGCFREGCQFTIAGDPKPGNIYVMEDRGSAIIGKHLDYFAGIGEAALRSNPIKGTQTIQLDAATCAP